MNLLLLWRTGEIEIRAVTTGKVLREQAIESTRFADSGPDGTKIAVATAKGLVSIWDADSLKHLFDVECEPHKEIYQVRWNPHSTRFAVCGDGRVQKDYAVRIYDGNNGQLVDTIDHRASCSA